MTPMKGFTLIETMVAVTILALAIAGPFNAIQGALTNSFAARDQLIASALAQEGIEYIRSIRDDNYLAGADWLEGLDECMPGPCIVDPTQGEISTTVAPLKLSDTGLYNHDLGPDGGTASRFTRTIAIETVSANEIRISATVAWKTSGGTFTTVLTENLRDWL